MTNKDLSQPQRQRTSVAIQGLDRSTPDDIVTDGKCQELHNLRFKDNAWRPVHPHKVKYSFRSALPLVTQLYNHPATGSGKFIVRSVKSMVPWDERYYLVDVNGNSNEIASFSSPHSISHFGNVLMFTGGNNISYFYLKNGEYIPFAMPEPPRIKSINKKLYPIRPWKFSQGYGWIDFPKDGADVSLDTYMRVAWPIADMITGAPKIPITPDASYEDAINSWHGEVAFFAAYEMADGTIIAPSLMSIIASENDVPNNTRAVTSNTYGGDSKLLAIEHSGPPSGDATFWVDSAMHFVIGEAQYFLPAGINTEMITNIVCFCTRINSIFDYGKIIPSEQSYSGISLAYANNALPTQPFYLLASKPLSASSTFAVFNLNAKNLVNIDSNRVYEPNNNIHLTFGNVSLDYNNRLHLADITTKLFEGYNAENFISPTSVEELKEYTIAASLEINNVLHYPKRIDTLDSIPASPRPTPRIITYPDFRAKQFFIQHSEDITSAFDLTPAAANNIAYYLPTPTSALKYPEVSFGAELGAFFFPDSNSFAQTNNLIVSSPNNPFSFPYENSYSFGSSNNRILAMQSGAIETHEMKVGELPLYVFTEEGIFALIAGQNTLYSSVVAINYDKIINPNTLAINGAIVYITEKGVHLLTSQGSQIISSPIHGEDGMPDLAFLKSCKILYPKQYNEFALYNDNGLYPSAFIFNLDTGYWSTRTLTGKKLNTDELYNDNKIYDLGDEDETKFLPVSIQTRPIKLGNVELKRLETIIPRFQVGNSHPLASMSIDGSIDGSTYMRLRTIQPMEFYSRLNPFVIRRTPFSAKYFKLRMDITPIEGEDYAPSITNIDFEWYARFVRRMR